MMQTPSLFRRRLSGLLFSLLPLIALLSGCSEYKEVQVTQISGVKIVKMTDKGIDLEIGMKINNPNSYGFTIFKSAFDLRLSGTDLGTATLTKKEKIGGNSEEIHTFCITTTPDKLLSGGIGSLMGLFNGKNTELEIKGKLRVGRFLYRRNIPVERKQKTNLDNQAGGSLLNLFKK